MKIKIFATLLAAGLSAPVFAAPLTESTFTEVVKEVNKVAPDTKAAESAKVNDVLKAPNLVRTGPDSRAELMAADETLTRIGANTVFSFDPDGRDMSLEKGSVLFHSPKGKGGGTIKSGGASAAVLGTTIIVAATADGGFKFVVLEGNGKAKLKNGKSRTLKAGQIVYILPGGKDFSKVLEINLGNLVAGSQLVNGFSRKIASSQAIQKAVEAQKEKLKSGSLRDTGQSVDSFLDNWRPGNGVNTIDDNTYKMFELPLLRYFEQ